MHLSITHETTYHYDPAVTYSIQSLRLAPRGFDGLSVQSWQVTSNGRNATVSGEDGFGNIVHTLTNTGDHEQVHIQARGEVLTSDTNGVVKGLREPFRPLFYRRTTPLTKAQQNLIDLAEETKNKTEDELEFAHRLMDAVRDAVEYETGATEATNNASEVLAMGRGVCQDHAHIFISCARHIGSPARYVSGYLWTGGEQGPFDASHAWAEIFITNIGWVGFDVANRTCPTEAHVRVAVGLDYLDAAPIRGLRTGLAEEAMKVQVYVGSTDQ